MGPVGFLDDLGPDDDEGDEDDEDDGPFLVIFGHAGAAWVLLDPQSDLPYPHTR